MLHFAYIEQPDQSVSPELKNALERMRSQRLNNRAQPPDMHHPCFGVVPNQKLLIRKQEDQMDHVKAPRGIRTRQPLPDSGHNLSTSMPSDRGCAGAVKAADEGFEGIVDELVVADCGNQAQPVGALGTSYGVKSHENVVHLSAEEFVLEHRWRAV
jgi:hypothetical protein